MAEAKRKTSLVRKSSLVEYEEKRSSTLFSWIIDQCPYKQQGISILDFSGDGGIFTNMLVAEMRRECPVPVQRVVIAVRDINGITTDPAKGFEFVPFIYDESSRKAFKERFASLGKHDLIIVKEMLYEVHEYVQAFFEALKLHCLRDEGSRMVIMTRAKEYPAVPVPSTAMMQWREMAVSEHQLHKQLKEVQRQMKNLSRY